MKAGDILVSAASTVSSLVIQTGTASTYSHAAIAISDVELIEATIEGVSQVSLADFLEANKRVTLLSRPEELELSQRREMEKVVSEVLGRAYAKPKSLLSGISRIGSYIVPISILVTIIALWYWNNLRAGLLQLAVMVLLWGTLYLAAKPSRMDALLERLGLKLFLSKSDTHFCSELVMIIDQRIGGKIHLKCTNIHDPRPKEIFNAAQSLGFGCTMLKG